MGLFDQIWIQANTHSFLVAPGPPECENTFGPIYITIFRSAPGLFWFSNSIEIQSFDPLKNRQKIFDKNFFRHFVGQKIQISYQFSANILPFVCKIFQETFRIEIVKKNY